MKWPRVIHTRPNMTAKPSRDSAARPVPSELADVAFLDINDVCAAVRMSSSWVQDEVREGRFPQPLRFGARCTRWRAADVRAYLIKRAELPQEGSTALVVSRAKRASEAARAKRAGLQAQAS